MSVLSQGTSDAVFAFCLERLKNYLTSDYQIDTIDAVLALKPTQLNQIEARLKAVSAFKSLPESIALSAANKRVINILKKNILNSKVINIQLFELEAEIALFSAVSNIKPMVNEQLIALDYHGALSSLVGLKEPIDAFFDQVMVMADKIEVRHNRLALLSALSDLLNSVADISILSN